MNTPRKEDEKIKSIPKDQIKYCKVIHDKKAKNYYKNATIILTLKSNEKVKIQNIDYSYFYLEKLIHMKMMSNKYRKEFAHEIIHLCFPNVAGIKYELNYDKSFIHLQVDPRIIKKEINLIPDWIMLHLDLTHLEKAKKSISKKFHLLSKPWNLIKADKNHDFEFYKKYNINFIEINNLYQNL